MMIDNSAAYWVLVVGLLAGLLIGFVLWAFRLISWWGIIASAVGVPAALVGLVFVIFVAMWIAGGSH